MRVEEDREARRWLPRGWVVSAVVAVVLLAVVLVIYAWNRNTGDDRDELLRTLADTAFTFLLVGLVAAGVRLMVEQTYKEREAREQRRSEAERQAADKMERDLVIERQRQARLDEIRIDMVRRLVAVVNDVRRAPMLLEANRSAKTYSEQMRTIADGRFELGLMIHELEVGDRRRIFTEGPTIIGYLETMQRCFVPMLTEFSEHQTPFANKQRAIEAEKDLPANERLRDELWTEMRSLTELSELLRFDPAAPVELAPDGTSGQVQGSPSPLRKAFLDPYTEALALMQREIVLGASAPPGSPGGPPPPR